jgi:glycine/serine hydroxymethyltransferase
MTEKEMPIIADFLDRVLKAPTDAQVAAQVAHEVESLCKKFPLPYKV